MFVDASALVAVLLREPDGQRFSGAMERADRLFISPIVVFETVAAIMRERKCSSRDARQAVEKALRIAGIETISITREIGDLALQAFEKYGKGSGHRAQLNMGVASPMPARNCLTPKSSTRATTSLTPIWPKLVALRVLLPQLSASP